jgi:aminoglycoside phosphotransferase (APT) family kinase protein
VAVLDWELASIGPPEMDLAWYLALDRLTAKFTGTVPGFLDRARAIDYYESHLGRAVVDLEWHEIFALVRSAAINDRQARIAAAAGVPYPGVAGDDNPVLRYITRRIDRYGLAQ